MQLLTVCLTKAVTARNSSIIKSDNSRHAFIYLLRIGLHSWHVY